MGRGRCRLFMLASLFRTYIRRVFDVGWSFGKASILPFLKAYHRISTLGCMLYETIISFCRQQIVFP